MPDISSLIEAGALNPFAYLPLAILLGALHALEPGHAKSVMAGFIIAIRGTARQAVLLGVSAAVGHTIIVWGLALLGLYLGEKLIADRAEPWLTLASGLLILVLAARLLLSLRAHGHHHVDDHDHDGDHDHHGHTHASPQEIAKTWSNRTVSTGEIIWFGFSGGLLPCPSAIAVLLVCLRLKAFALGVAMVAAFSLGLAFTMVSVGVLAAWGTRKAAQSFSGFEKWSAILPWVSAAIVVAIGLAFTVKGLQETGLL